MQNPLLKILYCAGQGIFLPLVLWLDDLRASGQYLEAVIVFAIYTLLVVGDAWLYWIVFGREKSK